MSPALVASTVILILFAGIRQPQIVNGIPRVGRHAHAVCTTVNTWIVRTTGGEPPGAHEREETPMQYNGPSTTPQTTLPHSEEDAPELPMAPTTEEYIRRLEATVESYRNGLLAAHAAARGLAESLRVAGNPVSDQWNQRQAALLAEATYVWANTGEETGQ